MIAAHHDRDRPCRQNLAHGEFDIGMAACGVGMNDIRVADIDDLDLGWFKIGDVILVIIGSCMTEREQRRSFADRTRPHPRT